MELIARTQCECSHTKFIFFRVQVFHAHVTWDTDCLIALSHYFPEKFILEKIAMRIPLLAYFLVMGIILFSGLVLVSSQLEFKPLPVSQRIGVPPPFKASPDANELLPSTLNSAAE